MSQDYPPNQYYQNPSQNYQQQPNYNQQPQVVYVNENPPSSNTLNTGKTSTPQQQPDMTGAQKCCACCLGCMTVVNFVNSIFFFINNICCCIQCLTGR